MKAPALLHSCSILLLVPERYELKFIPSLLGAQAQPQPQCLNYMLLRRSFRSQLAIWLLQCVLAPSSVVWLSDIHEPAKRRPSPPGAWAVAGGPFPGLAVARLLSPRRTAPRLLEQLAAFPSRGNRLFNLELWVFWPP